MPDFRASVTEGPRAGGTVDGAGLDSLVRHGQLFVDLRGAGTGTTS